MKLTKKDKKQITKWIVALRSGGYKQARGRLQNQRGFCCLGVACEVLIPEKRKDKLNGLLSHSLPSAQEYAPIWLKDLNIYFYIEYGKDLAHLNDKERKDFNYIADLIELEFFTFRGEEMELYL